MRWFAAQPGTRVFHLSYPLAWQRLSQDKKTALEAEGIHLLGPLEHFSSIRVFRTHRHGMQVKRLIAAHNITAVIIIYIAPGGLWANFRKRWNVPVLLWALGTDVNEVMHSAFTGTAFRSRADKKNYLTALASADAVMAASDDLLQSLRHWQPAIRRSAVIYCAIPTAQIQAAAGKEPRLEGKQYILFPRYMRPVYQHELSLQAIRLLPPHLLSAYTMVFVDADGPDKDYISKISSLMAATPQAQFLWLPQQDQESLWSLCKRASLVVMHPLSDGTPVSALEAMVCRVPLLLGAASYDPGLFAGVPQLSANDPTELAAKMQSVLSNPPSQDALDAAMHNTIRLTDQDTVHNGFAALIRSITTTGGW